MRESFVSPFQGDEVCGTKILGLRAARFTPGFNIPGFQPFQLFQPCDLSSDLSSR